MAKDKVRRPRAETPKGFRDYRGAEVTERAWMLARIAEVYHAHGFDALETSAVETVEALGKFLPDVDRPNEGVFAWQEDDTGSGADWLALRYDLTAPLARFYAQNRNDLSTPYRRYAMGPVWRNEKPGPGRYKQFYQCDADTVGTASVAADAEMCAMLCDALEAVGIDRGDYVVRVNNRKVLNGVMETAGILDPADPDRFAHERGIVLRAIDKLDRLGEEGVRALLGEGRRDESGDFTHGAKLSVEQTETLMAFVRTNNAVRTRLYEFARNLKGFGGSDLLPRHAAMTSNRAFASFLEREADEAALWNRSVVSSLRDQVRRSRVGAEGVDELEEIADLLVAQGHGPDRIMVDPSVVRGLGYYTGPVFEAELVKGELQRFGSVAGGGRYDDLVKRFTGQAVPATGVSIGVDRLLAALRAKGRIGASAAEGPVVVTVMDRDRMADYQAMAAELRDPKDGGPPIRAEVYLGNPKNFGNQLKYADRRGSPVAIIEGADEKARGVVQVKDLVLGAKIAESASLEEWKDRPSQVEVPRDDLVATVRRMLAP